MLGYSLSLGADRNEEAEKYERVQRNFKNEGASLDLVMSPIQRIAGTLIHQNQPEILVT